MKAERGAWTPTHYTEDPNLFSELDCNLLGLGETFGVCLQCVYLWVLRSASNLPLRAESCCFDRVP
jgi:hypothetical protein